MNRADLIDRIGVCIAEIDKIELEGKRRGFKWDELVKRATELVDKLDHHGLEIVKK